MLDLAAVAVLVAAGILLVWWVADTRSRRRLAVRRRVVVNIDTGAGDTAAVSGILWERSGRHLIIRDAVVHTGGQSVPADGDVIIDRDHVLYVQALEAS